MAVSTERLEDVLTEAGVSPEAAPSVVAELQRFVDEAIAAQAGSGSSEARQRTGADSTEARLIRLEQKFDSLLELMTIRFNDIDRRFDEVDRRFDEVDRRFELVDRRFEDVDRRFGEVDRRFGDVDKRLDRERLERLGFVTAAAGAITAALLRLFGAI